MSFKKIEQISNCLLGLLGFGIFLAISIGIYWERGKKATLEKRFEVLVERLFKERTTAATVEKVLTQDPIEPIEFTVGKILPILVKNRKAKLSAEVFLKLPEHRRPSTPEDVQTIVFIEHLGSYQTEPVRGITTYHSTTVQRFGVVLADISHPQLESPQQLTETAATLVEEVPVDDITEFLSKTERFKASTK